MKQGIEPLIIPPPLLFCIFIPVASLFYLIQHAQAWHALPYGICSNHNHYYMIRNPQTPAGIHTSQYKRIRIKTKSTKKYTQPEGEDRLFGYYQTHEYSSFLHILNVAQCIFYDISDERRHINTQPGRPFEPAGSLSLAIFCRLLHSLVPVCFYFSNIAEPSLLAQSRSKTQFRPFPSTRTKPERNGNYIYLFHGDFRQKPAVFQLTYRIVL